MLQLSGSCSCIQNMRLPRTSGVSPRSLSYWNTKGTTVSGRPCKVCPLSMSFLWETITVLTIMRQFPRIERRWAGSLPSKTRIFGNKDKYKTLILSKIVTIREIHIQQNLSYKWNPYSIRSLKKLTTIHWLFNVLFMDSTRSRTLSWLSFSSFEPCQQVYNKKIHQTSNRSTYQRATSRVNLHDFF